MGDQGRTGEYLNPKQVISSGLPDILIPNDGRTVSSPSLTEWFNGHMDPWLNFKAEMTEFYRSEDLQQAFELCKDVRADNNLEQLRNNSPHFAGFEHMEIGEERDLQGRFTEHVIHRVLCVLKCITQSPEVSNHVAKLKKLPLTSDVNIGSAKTVPPGKRKKHEPDIVFRIPGSDEDQTVRIVGELKFPRTCFITDALYEPDPAKMRHIFGQVARDMREHGTRYGFVSTYESTVFLKISRNDDGSHSLLHSKPIVHSQALVDDNANGLLSEVSVRFAMFWLIHQAQHQDHNIWAIEPSDIKGPWTDDRAKPMWGSEATPRETPVKNFFNKFRRSLNRLTRTSQRDQTTSPHASTSLMSESNTSDIHQNLSRLTLTPRQSRTLSTDHSSSLGSVGNTPDDPKDPDYVDSKNSTPSPSPVRADDGDSSSDEEEDPDHMPPLTRSHLTWAPRALPGNDARSHTTGSGRTNNTRSRTAQ